MNKKGFSSVEFNFVWTRKRVAWTPLLWTSFEWVLKHGNKDRKHKDLKTLSSKGETFMGGAIVILTPLEGGESGWIEFNASGCREGS